jgi:predicted dehydrogenase/threonine dehydrogenase-like Zn-dependent dehydrogenase
MKQLTQKLGTGEMIVQDVPTPQVGVGMIMVRNHYSIISSGTEESTVTAARKNLFGKAKERPQQVKQVIETLKKQGPLQTYRAVQKKLDAYSPLGYSSAGEVIDVGEGVNGFSKGDLVACAGVGYANHAEVVSVPKNLVVRLNDDANLRDAAYNTIGAIAMQGVRQADIRLGETAVIIGLGLLGQIAGQITRASGVNTIGIDISDYQIEMAIKNSAVDFAFGRNEKVEQIIMELTHGHGADVVIIAARTSSLDPINLAGALTRKKGKVVVLGAVPTGFDRDPHWYRKELELIMSCSYGPGRYDIDYEEKGGDYPYAYVRWTQNRNMMAFQQLLTNSKINIDYLTTHEFPFSDATKAYDLLMDKNEPFTGIALRYSTKGDREHSKIGTGAKVNKGKLSISFIGAGSYAQSNLLPHIPSDSEIVRKGVLTNSGTTSKRIAEKYKFEFCTSSEDDVFNKETNTVFIATRHDSHAKYVLKGIRENKNIFVEKPICLYETELEEIISAYSANKAPIMIGFNRRFSPSIKAVKKELGSGRMAMLYRINAGSIPSNSWIQDLSLGGGRIVGEVCHFVDLLTFVNGSLPIKISAMCMPDNNGCNDTLNISLKFKNGSIGTIAYYANGSSKLSKEYLEIHSGGQTAIIDDFKTLKIFKGGKVETKKLFNQNKGQKEMMSTFLSSLLTTGESPIAIEEIFAVTNATFQIINSLNNGSETVRLN